MSDYSPLFSSSGQPNSNPNFGEWSRMSQQKKGSQKNEKGFVMNPKFQSMDQEYFETGNQALKQGLANPISFFYSPDIKASK